ncbi:hypothetical protein CPB84DRAFT_1745132 [Gymnopilus junonius]|uniref:Uncharacterized protein n=1 Tax=Gymnopilus junonius TaxID=109634 RepID=A0A9P5NRR6_GYMJU|nr:hypothetical protein CPB84DRAFT_1745132 [Gymnopilus junonius]
MQRLAGFKTQVGCVKIVLIPFQEDQVGIMNQEERRCLFGAQWFNTKINTGQYWLEPATCQIGLGQLTRNLVCFVEPVRLCHVSTVPSSPKVPRWIWIVAPNLSRKTGRRYKGIESKFTAEMYEFVAAPLTRSSTADVSGEHDPVHRVAKVLDTVAMRAKQSSIRQEPEEEAVDPIPQTQIEYAMLWHAG